MSSLLYEPAEGDPHRVLAPAFPFCYPPQVHRYADWVPVDGWREGPPKGWYVGEAPPTPRVALVLIWKGGEPLNDSVDRVNRILWAHTMKVILTPEATAQLMLETLGGQLIVWENG